MWCMKCNSDLATCTCEDLAARLATLGRSSHFVYRMCRKCGRNYAKCECPEPEWTTSEKTYHGPEIQ